MLPEPVAESTYPFEAGTGPHHELPPWPRAEDGESVAAMRGPRERWKSDELIDFEVALAAWDGQSRPEELPATESRSLIFKAWQASQASSGSGKKWVRSLNIAGLLFGWFLLLAGFGAGWGCFDRQREGVHVVVFLAVTLFIPWLVLLAGMTAWLFRPARVGLIAPLLKKLATRFAGEKGREVAARIEGNPELAKALGWRTAALAQNAAMDFHLGALLSLSTMVFFRRVGFFWETTTDTAMQKTLEGAVKLLSSPWASFAPQFVPNVAETRRGAGWQGGGEGWIGFLLLALVVWGVAPRVLLQLFAKVRERLALRSPSFQSPAHRKLWRVLTGVKRGSDPKGPTDGALVIDLGGISPNHEALRPHFLRHLRMNPVAWHTLDVLDEGREAAAGAALQKAPAGVILLAEGWSLAPRRMEETLKRVLEAGGGRRVVIHVANFDKEGRPREVKPDERAAWEAFLDSQKGLEVELSMHEEDRTWAPG